MTDSNKTRADRLYDAIGDIDDRIIDNAKTPARALAYKKSIRRLLFVGVAAALIMCTLTTTTSTVLFDSLMQGGMQAPPSDSVQPSSLDKVLENADGNSRIAHLSEEDIDFFDKEPKLIWQSTQGEEYSVLPIPSIDVLSDLKKEISKNSERLSPSDEAPQYVMWISYGDGTVISPHLALSEGNCGNAELFDYSAEYLPNETFTNIVYDLINE